MKQGSDEQKIASAARATALSMDRNNPARQVIYDLVNAFEKLHRVHDLCMISRAVNAPPVNAPASCDCQNKLNGVKLCRNHGIDRITFIGKTLAPHYEMIATLAPEREAISHALAHDIVKVTKVAAVGRAQSPGAPRPISVNKQKATDILSAINASLTK